ncbi:MAG: protein translocase subunit SecD [Bacteroidales bacterium]|nr:protein translocase subunit SecD [Bacteroidales bacterium]
MWLSFLGIILLAAGAAFIDYPKTPGFKIGSFSRDLNVRLGLDLKGGSMLLYQADTSQVDDQDKQTAVDGVRDVIERRVNAYGVSEPVVRTMKSGDSWRISVELAGITDVNEAIKLIGETPTLEFKEEAVAVPLTEEQKKQAEEQNAAVKQLAQDVLQKALNGEDFVILANTYSEDPSNVIDSTTNQKAGGDLGFAQQGSYATAFDDVLFTKMKDGEIYPELVETEFGYHIIKRITSQTINQNGEQIQQVRASHILFRTQSTTETISEPYTSTGLTGKNLRRAEVQYSQTTSEPEVSLQFDTEGAKLFGELTERNIGKTLAIYLDGIAISTPQVNTAITNGQAVITGSFTLDEAKDLAKRLNSGALPVPVTLIQQQTVQASLGEQSIYRSFFAGVLGFALVALFMIACYRLPGLLAVIALSIYTLIILALFKLWPVTLTLAGVAGFILSIGIAVDANILIFERTKEELRAGAPLLRAIETGFERAWASIRDSNISSIITSLILIWLGTSFIKGFAVTLIIGILVSLFSAITITRTFLRLTNGIHNEKRLWLFGVKQKKENQENT